MVKFSRQLEAQLIPEWKDAFVNYRQLKKNIKNIILSRPRQDSNNINMGGGGGGGGGGNSSSFSVLDMARRLKCRVFGTNHHHNQNQAEDEEQYVDVELVHSREDEVKQFFEKLDEELEKVNEFYKDKEAEFVERGEVLKKQVQILVDLKKILPDRQCRLKHLSSFTNNSGRFSSSSASEMETEEATPTPTKMMSPMAEELVAALERNGVSFIGSTKSNAKPRTTSMRIDIPSTTPTRTISTVSSVIWEDISNNNSKKEDGGDYITRKKIQCADKIIRGACLELYRGLELLKNYSSLNMVAFTKILKKFNKVSRSDQLQESESYLRKVERSHFVSSDKAVRLRDEVESTFTKHFANNDRKTAMKFLRPQQPKDSHTITFLVGLFTGSFVTLLIVYGFLAHLAGIFTADGTNDYLQNLYPIFSVFALLSLHIFLYGCNLYSWKRTRINKNFIFEFNSTTALKYRDAFLISATFMTVVVGTMVTHLFLISSGISPHRVDSIPGIILPLFMLVLLCPFNIFYRSTRLCFLRIIRNIVLSPFYRVLMVDFFMADQLTSQIPLMRHMEFTACFFMAGGFKTHSYETCTSSRSYKLLSYIISFLPYYWRAMQCVRRYVEEGYDINHVANAGKYISAVIAAAAKMKYAMDPSPLCLFIVVLTKLAATFYQLYWDFVKDWGLFNKNSRNRFLRDNLVLKNTSIYYASIVLNFLLRLAWVESITRVSLGSLEHRLVDFLLALLEVIRRGHWNYYRLENEHLNNVGKFRAVKAVPLPFREVDSD